MWSGVVGDVLGLRSYLLGDPATPAANAVNNAVAAAQGNGPNDGDLGVAHDQLDLMLVNTPNRPAQAYQKPSYFTARVVALLVLLAMTGTLFSGILLTLPVRIAF